VHLQLADIIQQLELASVRLGRLANETSAEIWNRRPTPESWSAAECVAHLNLTGSAYLPLLNTALEEARAVDAPAPRHFRRTFAGFLLTAMMGPLPQIGRRRLFKVPTAPSFVPTATAPREALIAEFSALQREQIEIVRRADELPLHMVRVRSPFTDRVTYDVYSALLLLPRHQHRHLQQAELARPQ
jgi:hypothetical protein